MFTQNADQTYRDAIYKKMLAADHNMGISALYECIKWNSEKEPRELKIFSGKLANINGAPTGHEKKLHESVVLIPGVGHFVAQLKPEEFNAALKRQIERFNAQ
jgi:pimeloyl-ACP methyl ester carboxylesterase